MWRPGCVVRALALLLIGGLDTPCEAATWEGWVYSSNCFQDVGTFGYDVQPQSGDESNLLYTIQYPREYDGDLSMVAYFDDEVTTEFLQASDNNDLTCQERLNYARENGYITLLERAVTLEKTESDFGIVNLDIDTYTVTAKTSIYQDFRRFWTFAFINTAKSTTGLENVTYIDGPLQYIFYKIEAQNMGKTLRFAGVNEEPAVWASGVMLVLQLLVTCLGAWTFAQMLVERKLNHIFTITFVAVLMELVSLVFNFVYYLHFALFDTNRVLLNAGEAGNMAQYAFGYVGSLLHFLSTATLLLVVCLLAKGWNIVRYKIAADGRVKLVVFFTLYLCFHVVMVSYASWSDEGLASSGKVFLPFFSPLIGVQVAINVFALVWVCRITFLTVTTFQKKKALLIKMGVVGAVWLAAQIVCPFIAEALTAYDRMLFLVIFVPGPNLVLEFIIVTLFFPEGEIRKLFHFEDNATKRSFGSSLVNFDEPNTDNLTPVQEVYEQWMKRHASSKHTPAELLVGKMSHVVLHLRMKRDALASRLRMFQMLLKSNVPDLKSVSSFTIEDGENIRTFDPNDKESNFGLNNSSDDDAGSGTPALLRPASTANTTTIDSGVKDGEGEGKEKDTAGDDTDLLAAARKKMDKKAKKAAKKEKRERERRAQEEEEEQQQQQQQQQQSQQTGGESGQGLEDSSLTVVARAVQEAEARNNESFPAAADSKDEEPVAPEGKDDDDDSGGDRNGHDGNNGQDHRNGNGNGNGNGNTGNGHGNNDDEDLLASARKRDKKKKKKDKKRSKRQLVGDGSDDEAAGNGNGNDNGHGRERRERSRSRSRGPSESDQRRGSGDEAGQEAAANNAEGTPRTGRSRSRSRHSKKKSSRRLVDEDED